MVVKEREKDLLHFPFVCFQYAQQNGNKIDLKNEVANTPYTCMCWKCAYDQ